MFNYIIDIISVTFSHSKCAIKAIVWIVFPSPISSANIPLILFSCNVTSQSNPICWYSLNVCWIKNGIFVLTLEADRLTPVGWNFSAHWAAWVIIASSLSTTSYFPISFFCTIKNILSVLFSSVTIELDKFVETATLLSLSSTFSFLIIIN